jgi:hypothetical protein
MSEQQGTPVSGDGRVDSKVLAISNEMVRLYK